VALRHSHPPAVEVTRNGTSVALTAHEFNTLEFFVENSNRVITRTELLKTVCGYEDGYTTNRTIDNYIVKFRINWRTIHPVRPSSERYLVSAIGSHRSPRQEL